MGSILYFIKQIDKLSSVLKYTILHPQWLSNRCHKSSRNHLRDIKHSLILDIGSGNSQYDGILDNSNTIIKLDFPSTNELYACRPNIFADACQIPINSACIDAVLFLEVLEHVADADAAMLEIGRILKPGGYLYISVPFTYPVHDIPQDFRRLTLFGLRRLLSINNFESTKEIRHGNAMITIFQLLNLTLLEWVQNLLSSNRLFAFVSLCLVYPITLCNNLLAALFLSLTWNKRLYLGYFIIAQLKTKKV